MKKIRSVTFILLLVKLCSCQDEPKKEVENALEHSIETTKNLLKSIEKTDALSDEIEQNNAELDSILSIGKSQEELDLLESGRAFKQYMADSLGISPNN